MSSTLTPGLPVAGYRPQSEEALALVNRNKEIEERVLRVLDDLYRARGVDPGRLFEGRRMIETGFMLVNRAVFQPGRVRLPEDAAPAESDPALPASEA